MNIEGKEELKKQKQEEIRSFGEVREEGEKMIDIGCMKIKYN